MVESTPNPESREDGSSKDRPHDGCSAHGSGETLDDAESPSNGIEKVFPTTAVRFGYMRYIGEFSHPVDMRFTCGTKLVIQTQRGIELGEQVSLTCTGSDKAATPQQIKEWVDRSGPDAYVFNAGRILREATAADLAEFVRIQNGCREKRDLAQQVAEKHNLPLKVVECECPLGGERIIFYFTAAERVDFRGMVKDLAKEYRTRIEMRQIGARDEARLLADYETCGREICCKVFLKTLKPISMRMAKVQKATLDPSQVSGRCGRLKCCLRFEHAAYEELDKRLPRVGVRIRTNHGEGVVTNRQILTQLVQIRTDNNTLLTVVMEDVTAVDVEAPGSQDTASDPLRLEQESAEQPAGALTDPKKKPASPRAARPTPKDRAKRTRPDPERADSPKAPPGKEKDGERPTSRRRKRRRRPRGRHGPGGSGGGSSPSTR